MQLTVLGSGTFQPTAKRGCSGYLVQIEENNVLLDSGAGVLRQLAKTNITAEDIDLVFISHLHIDHISDLVPFLFAKKQGKHTQKKDISLYGPPGFKEYFSRIESLYYKSIHPENYNISIFEYDGVRIKFADFSIGAYPVKHTENSYGFRFVDNNGIVLAYSGDTDYCDNLITLCKNSNVAIIECTFPDDRKVEGHLTPSEAGRAAHLAECKRVLLTHLDPMTNEKEIISSCSNHFKGGISIAEELDTVNIS